MERKEGRKEGRKSYDKKIKKKTSKEKDSFEKKTLILLRDNSSVSEKGRKEGRVGGREYLPPSLGNKLPNEFDTTARKRGHGGRAIILGN